MSASRNLILLFLLPALFVILLTLALGYWSIRTVDERQQSASALQHNDLQVIRDAAKFSEGMSLLHMRVVATLEKAEERALSELQLYFLHAEFVEELNQFGERVAHLAHSDLLQEIDESSAAALVHEFHEYRRFVLQATDIAAVDYTMSHHYLDAAGQHFANFTLYPHRISQLFVERASVRIESISRESRQYLTQIMIVGGVALFLILMLALLITASVSQKLRVIANALFDLSRDKNHLPELPAIEALQKHSDGDFGRMARALLAFRDTKSRLLEAQQLASIGNWEWLIQDGSLYWSDEVYRIFGLIPREFEETYEAFLGYVHPEDRHFVEESVRLALEEKRPYSIDHRIILADGTLKYVHERGEVKFDDSGTPLRMMGTIQDVTRVKMIENALRANQVRYQKLSEQFRALLDAIPDAIVEVDREYVIRWANDGAAEFYRQPASMLPGKRCYEILQGRTEPCETCPIEAYVAGRRKSTGIITLGATTWEVNAAPGSFDTKKEIATFITISRNITQRVQMQQDAMRTAHLSLLGQLSAGVAHEINNPNSFIMLNTSVLDDIWRDMIRSLPQHVETLEDFSAGGFTYPELRHEVPEMLARIHRATERIKGIVEHLKAFSTQDKMSLNEPVQLNDVVHGATSMLASETKKRAVALRFELGENLPTVRGSAARLEQIIINFIMNALEAVPEKRGEITVATYRLKGDDMLAVEVRDNGCGIDTETLARLFEPFYTTKRGRGGTGLGLSISRATAEEHGGSIVVESTVGAGATFRLLLPVGK
ncbi:PAS domain-containing sensor histidine kinase [Chrysiogenes arsenatis]|uniref:PAS domain-containing sensor histidine kinase n=1 Tax=Chrysiogenes arsenatis TaxID=309797 RepID=UPI0004286DAC|nr:PAS domain-containing sensor histidine kinase [Chrysiogenes arsenatis]